MTDDSERERVGLEGIPVNSAEVWSFDALRGSTRASDVGALFFIWLMAVGLAALALWGGSVILGVISIAALAIASWWTFAKYRSRLGARRERDRNRSVQRNQDGV